MDKTRVNEYGMSYEEKPADSDSTQAANNDSTQAASNDSTKGEKPHKD